MLDLISTYRTSNWIEGSTTREWNAEHYANIGLILGADDGTRIKWRFGDIDARRRFNPRQGGTRSGRQQFQGVPGITTSAIRSLNAGKIRMAFVDTAHPNVDWDAEQFRQLREVPPTDAGVVKLLDGVRAGAKYVSYHVDGPPTAANRIAGGGLLYPRINFDQWGASFPSGFQQIENGLVLASGTPDQQLDDCQRNSSRQGFGWGRSVCMVGANPAVHCQAG